MLSGVSANGTLSLLSLCKSSLRPWTAVAYDCWIHWWWTKEWCSRKSSTSQRAELGWFVACAILRVTIFRASGTKDARAKAGRLQNHDTCSSTWSLLPSWQELKHVGNGPLVLQCPISPQQSKLHPATKGTANPQTVTKLV
ncbi:hypothetical protein BKA70DRAFT_1226196 [Coprinopsis sp. MPI-PUGE-AT-0042]|nr:hypothetical protein BKA70DRAFT_1226196 [Coprinopsis sp. MPI-PUGE-AT-0042]